MSYNEMTAASPRTGARPSRLSDLGLHAGTRSAVSAAPAGICNSVCGDALLSSQPCLTDLAEWVAMKAGRGDHEETRAHFP
ncbi:predicted protein [Streptomyces viridosporus ATCC 14672]|uniref:Predicted protein n=1 Tax=Streptomyces viridosporus (strain ATCC 14672 / DSM 40746 / JCM 4963 / KCTC 9882 / NRRL B-12104 / FH 1290) TaxID=566461 RepID=D5ZPW6_STRV1|nr:predicted protein [Streptomyces viridosporus ATCC 14672]